MCIDEINFFFRIPQKKKNILTLQYQDMDIQDWKQGDCLRFRNDAQKLQKFWCLRLNWHAHI